MQDIAALLFFQLKHASLISILYIYKCDVKSIVLKGVLIVVWLWPWTTAFCMWLEKRNCYLPDFWHIAFSITFIDEYNGD